MTLNPGLRLGPYEIVSPCPSAPGKGVGPGWDVSPDGERFLLNVPVLKSSSLPLSAVVNWTAGLRK